MATPPTFPTGLFGFGSKEVNIERQTLKGGTSLSGEQDIVSSDGGGRVFAEFSGGPMVDRNTNMAWRALQTILEEGVTAIIVPFCDVRHTPYLPSGSVPHSDGTPFSDGTEYTAGGLASHVIFNTALRATSLNLGFPSGHNNALVGGEWFAIQHPTKGWRAYRIATIVYENPGVATVTFRPPLREAVADGTQVEFAKPRCLMVQDGTTSSRVDHGRYGEASIRFVEAP